MYLEDNSNSRTRTLLHWILQVVVMFLSESNINMGKETGMWISKLALYGIPFSLLNINFLRKKWNGYFSVYSYNILVIHIEWKINGNVFFSEFFKIKKTSDIILIVAWYLICTTINCDKKRVWAWWFQVTRRHLFDSWGLPVTKWEVVTEHRYH